MPRNAPGEEEPQAPGQAATLLYMKLLLYQLKEYFSFERNNKETENNSEEIKGSCKAAHNSI